MSKKKWVFITLVFVVCCFMTTSSWAAKKIDFYKSNAKDFIRKLNENGNKGIGNAFGLTQDEEVVLIRQGKDFNGENHYRYQQTFKGYSLWGMQTIISKDRSNKKVIKLHGAVVQGAPNDVGSIPKKLDALGALRQMQEKHKEKDLGATWNFGNEKYGTYIYFHQDSKKALLCYVVSFFADTEKGNPSHPIFFINAKNNKVIHSYDMLRYADGVGPGGNQKVGYYYYGTDYPPFCVTANGSTCTMNCTNVKTVDLNHAYSGTTPYSYTCYENTHKEINGAYCPLNDAQYFGQVAFDMYNDWYGVPPLPFQLTLKVHYGVNHENAYWTGDSMLFGDGHTTFYPLVGLDIVAHEVSHGFTENDNNSNLIYSGQSGGINESFSDMAGEAAKYYMRGTNDFMCGYDIYKAPNKALRYLYNPPLDGISIDHVDDYYEGMDVHYSSGIFNKAFYLIATSPGWNTRKAFDIFVKANQHYWQPSTNFQQGAEGAQDAALDYGYSCKDVAEAFAVVGIPLPIPTITVTSPKSGVNWKIGNKYTITWNSSYVTGNVRIQLFKGTTRLGNITNNTANDGRFAWTIGTLTNGYQVKIPGSNYRVKIRSVNDSTIWDFSGYFTISEDAPKIAIVDKTPPTFGHTVDKGTIITDTFRVKNIGGGTLNFSVSDDRTWISVSPNSGSCESQQKSDIITVTITTSGLAYGSDNTGTITVSDLNASNSPQTISVTVSIRDLVKCKLYRYLNSSIGDHYYTTNWNELGNGAGGYVYEGIACWVHNSQLPGTKKFYRYLNSSIGDHYYTTNWNELGNGAGGYVYEGVAC
ncbi:MAG: hypothetical protein GTO45_27485, partial [Candidatus Aminicenantes bacterium]|nr:hypothetical protein [Candidatus Aminicenantes bacterium]NIM82539.1 hypothetical protein [Candidatus Aminicenantes bacterium]NIN21899.1 hypothetical protein [Candidatus Aminicenantes bacterium]NIN45677.1 hypothetical protein [Candidatus Aminicenantes bacterium]NIN88512.1 hypothetical protein [Candidatus Aminicenantes bacterium]